ncbi:MAG: hydrogenase maturation nickel metallochaperone HypA [Campylobacter sp.]|nr:hydrogenase maturation nickel metallochaperone HypA [Campylobacter sp.]
MHEVGLARHIIALCEEHAKTKNATRITRLDLTLGKFSGVIYESLMFAFSVACKGTMLENAEICVQNVEALGKCLKCSHTYELLNIYDICPKCGASNPAILQGREFKIVSINII